MTSDKQTVARLVEICKSQKVFDIVFSPGSRNAPLVIAFNADSAFNCYCIPDERVAAFYAMGMALQSGRTMAICCTSGSAVLNYSPAISEAYYQGIPLLVLTADRPEEWIDQGIGQCIRQNNVFENFVKASYTMPEEASDTYISESMDSMVFEAIQKTISGFKGPVHINIPLAEPLYGTTEILPSVGPYETPAERNEFTFTDELRGIWNKCTKKMVLMGLANPDAELTEHLEYLVQTGQIVLLTETGSNTYVEDAIQTIDRVITGFEHTPEKVQADLVITIGGPVVSKKIKALILNNKPQYNWCVTLDTAKDTFRALTHYLKTEPNQLFKALSSEESVNEESFQNTWIQSNRDLKNKHSDYVKQCEWSDLKVFDGLLSHIPTDTVLHMGNSSVVRYIQLFNQRADLEYYGNRGVSGIDGCTSTAMGFAEKSDKLNVLISGDMSFYYDSNAFWNRHIPSNFRLVIINNSGGGIFRIIPGPSGTSQLDDFFEVTHNQKAEHLIRHFGLEYYKAEDEKELLDVLTHFFLGDQKVKVLEIFTPRKVNDRVLKDYFDFLHK